MAFCPDDIKGLFEDFKVEVRIGFGLRLGN